MANILLEVQDANMGVRWEDEIDNAIRELAKLTDVALLLKELTNNKEN